MSGVRTVMITGCNRGLGLGFVELMLKRRPKDVLIATCRRPEEAHELLELHNSHSNLHILRLNLSDLNSYKTIADEVASLTKGFGLNLLINNAGIATKFTTLNFVKAQQLIDNFKTNTVAPIMLTKELLPLLKFASEKNSKIPVGINRAAVVNMSSVLGSITLNDNGGFYPYRCSKTALNAATHSMSIDLQKDKILVISMHPGWVKTDMGGENAPIDVKTSVDGMMSTLEKLNENDSGNFFQYDGKRLAW